jgi:hypothetical protein
MRSIKVILDCWRVPSPERFKLVWNTFRNTEYKDLSVEFDFHSYRSKISSNLQSRL